MDRAVGHARWELENVWKRGTQLGGRELDQLLRDAGYVRIEDLAGNTEVGEALGLARQTVSMRTERMIEGWPGPIVTLACGPIYDLSVLPRGPVGNPRGGALNRSGGGTGEGA